MLGDARVASGLTYDGVKRALYAGDSYFVAQREEWLREAGIALTNVFNCRPQDNKLEALCSAAGKGATFDGRPLPPLVARRRRRGEPLERRRLVVGAAAAVQPRPQVWPHAVELDRERPPGGVARQQHERRPVARVRGHQLGGGDALRTAVRYRAVRHGAAARAFQPQRHLVRNKVGTARFRNARAHYAAC